MFVCNVCELVLILQILLKIDYTKTNILLKYLKGVIGFNIDKIKTNLHTLRTNVFEFIIHYLRSDFAL